MNSVVFILVIVLSFSGFDETNIENRTKRLLLGTWISVEDSKSLFVFGKNGEVQEKYIGEATVIYKWEIIEEDSTNGLRHKTLKLTNKSDILDTYLYDINTISSMKLVLEYLENNKLLKFYKQGR